MRVRSLIGLATATAALGVPAAAHSETYCVGIVPGCAGVPAADLQSALDAAALSVEPDAVRIGAGEFSRPGGFDYGASSPIEVTGAGVGATVLSVTDAASSVLRVEGPVASTRVSDLSIAHGPPGLRTGLTVRGTAERIAISGASALHRGVDLIGNSTLRASTVVVPGTDPDAPMFAVRTLGAADAVIEDVRLEGGIGVAVEGGSATVSRARIRSTYGISAHNARVRLTSSLVRVTELGLSVRTTGLGAGELEADGVTIAAEGGGRAVRVDVTGGPALLALRNSAIVDADLPFTRTSTNSQPAAIEVSWSAVDLTRPVVAEGPGSVSLGPGNVASPPGLLTADSDHRPAAGSPLVDAGDPAPPGADGPALDLDGRARVLGPRRDIGAFELPPAPPAAGGAPATGAAGGPPPTLRPPARPCADTRGKALRRCRIAVRLRADLGRCASVRPGARARCRAVALRRAGLARCRLLAPRRATACRVTVLARPLPRVRRPRT